MNPTAEQWQEREANFIANMKALREANGLSQGALAGVLQQSGWGGIYQTTISRIENGERPVRVAEAEAIAAAVGSTLTKMLLPPDAQRMAHELRAAMSRFTKMHADAAHITSMLARGRDELLSTIADADAYADKHPNTAESRELRALIETATRQIGELAMGRRGDGERQAEA